ncbi:winged helix DNA-binding protein [Burkholderiaceae bacterium FT117]|uniref:winged helix DNA-binding protein n=1 Tax=Zeimonas sediminis TaxID=2944268 RepID=UPI0023431C04|nr:winged helix DNA-binding protein [Zeimonas sediminis]MCM5569079.1 winged helix DNA-binding protein [Zeimonas sediminis]
MDSRTAPGSRPASERPILSSSHLADGDWAGLSELEFGLIVAGHAFDRWIVRCMAAAGVPDLTVTDVLVLHHVHHRERAKKLADICFTLNYEDTHVVSYALRKLAGLGLVSSEKVGKEALWSTTKAGRETVERYRRVRDRCLLASAADGLGAAGGSGNVAPGLAELAGILRALSGLYDQAARAAASL